MDEDPADLTLSAMIAREWLSDPVRMLAFAIKERELESEARIKGRDPIAAKALRETAEMAEHLANSGGEFWGDW